MKRRTSNRDFGKRLSNLRKAKGLTQDALANKIGVSRRVIAYYEGETNFPPSHLIVPIAKALKVSTDELLGIKNIKADLDPEQAKLWRRLKKAEQLSSKDQKSLFDLLDALLLRSKTKK